MKETKKLTDYDIIDWVKCWVPMPRRAEYAATGVQKERGALGVEEAWVVRRGGKYAIVWVACRTIKGKRGVRISQYPNDPLTDAEAIFAALRWGTRAEAVAELNNA
jgi:hypothetical protein